MEEKKLVPTELAPGGNGKPEAESFKLTQDIVDEIPVRNFLTQYMMEKKRFPPLDVPGCKKKKLAICGLASTTRSLAPFGDQAFDIWACHAGFKILPRVDVTFEIHDPNVFGDPQEKFPDYQYLQELKTLKTPIFMDFTYSTYHKEHPGEIPTGIPYPIEEIVEQFGRYQTNTIEYMIWLAIRQGYEQIGVFGVEMEHDTEYNEQARGVIYALGIAMGRGIGVYLPPENQLFKCRWMYGFETAQRDLDTQRVEKLETDANAELNQRQAELNNALARFHESKGRVEALVTVKRRILKM